MCRGALIDYQLRLHGLPVCWRTLISVWEPPVRFIDLQIKGPYAHWEHSHTFEPVGEQAVVIGDRVRYALPLGPLGAIARELFIVAISTPSRVPSAGTGEAFVTAIVGFRRNLRVRTTPRCGQRWRRTTEW